MNADVLPGTDVASDLARRVRNQLHRRSELRHIGVDAEGGIVQLTGRVTSFYLKQLCISGSQKVPGVYRLIDQIQVVPPR